MKECLLCTKELKTGEHFTDLIFMNQQEEWICKECKEDFEQIGEIHCPRCYKDKEEKVCKDCEFRYICTDCRAYTEKTHTNEEGLDTSKPLKCGYNPYTGEWEEWSTNPLKQKAIQFYGMQDLIKRNEN